MKNTLVNFRGTKVTKTVKQFEEDNKISIMDDLYDSIRGERVVGVHTYYDDTFYIFALNTGKCFVNLDRSEFCGKLDELEYLLFTDFAFDEIQSLRSGHQVEIDNLTESLRLANLQVERSHIVASEFLAEVGYDSGSLEEFLVCDFFRRNKLEHEKGIAILTRHNMFEDIVRELDNELTELKN